MADKKLLRKIAPIIMSAAVAKTSSPVGVMAEDFTSGEVSVEVSDETIYDLSLIHILTLPTTPYV